MSVGENEVKRSLNHLLGVEVVSELLQCSPRNVYRLSDAGRMPQKVKVGRLARWSQAAIVKWIADGCPDLRPSKGGKR